MVNVRFVEGNAAEPSAVVARGHAGWDSAGSDVVCAAVSALLQGALLGLTDHAHIAVEYVRKPGELRFSWPPGESDRSDVRAIVETAALAIGQITAQYPDHVKMSRVKL